MKKREKVYSRLLGLYNFQDYYMLYLLIKREEFNTSENMMICQTCLDVPECSDKASTLISGTRAFRKDTLTAHWKSKSHKACEERKQLLEIAVSTRVSLH